MATRNRYGLLTPGKKIPTYFKTEKQREQAIKKVKSGVKLTSSEKIRIRKITKYNPGKKVKRAKGWEKIKW